MWNDEGCNPMKKAIIEEKRITLQVWPERDISDWGKFLKHFVQEKRGWSIRQRTKLIGDPSCESVTLNPEKPLLYRSVGFSCHMKKTIHRIKGTSRIPPMVCTEVEIHSYGCYSLSDILDQPQQPIIRCEEKLVSALLTIRAKCGY